MIASKTNLHNLYQPFLFMFTKFISFILPQVRFIISILCDCYQNFVV